MQVAGHHAVRSGGAQQVGDQLGADGHARTVLAVLARPAEIRHHGHDFVCGGALGGVDGEQQLHQVVCRRDGGLEDVDGGAADALLELGLELSVAERRDFERSQMQRRLIGRLEQVDVVDDLPGEVF